MGTRVTMVRSLPPGPVDALEECREKDLTYARPLTITVAFVNRETGEIREQSVFMGDFPWMTERGTFIINGTERVVVTQLVRSPGAYLMEAKDREKQVFIANLMPARGSWLELELDKELVSLPRLLGMPEEPEVEIKDYAAEAQTYPREAVAEHLDEYEHFGNRRLRTVGELIQEAFRIGLYRMERVVRERLTTEDADTITPQTIVNIRPVVAALKEFFGSSQLSQFMAQTNSPVDPSGRLSGDEIVCRTQAGQYVTVAPEEVDLIDVSPEQIWSVATAMIPFLEHDDANRALMGSNMQRQAVPLLKTDAPLVGTGMERRAAVDTGDLLLARNAGVVDFVDATRIVVNTSDGGRDEYELQKFMRSNQGTLIHQKPVIKTGQHVEAGDLLAD